MDKNRNYISSCRYVILLGSLVASLLNMDIIKFPAFIFLYLIIVINSQLRYMLLKKKAACFSILLEVSFVLYLNYRFSGFSFVILLSTLIDVCLLFINESSLLIIITGAAAVYSSYNSYHFQGAAITSIIFAAIVLLLLTLRRELRIREDTEALYDQIRRYSYELEGARSRLMDYSKQVEKVAQLEERNRISRELHDSIGHSLTGILMQVDACIQVMAVDREKGIEILKSVYQNISGSIETVRDTVRKMRPEAYQTGLDALKGLVNKFMNDTGIAVDFKIIGAAGDIPPAVETVLYRNIQEALTNSARHGHPKNIAINLIYKTQHIELFIEDDGEGCQRINKGFGISGMEERLSLIGGTVSISGNNGFHIHMIIPKGGTN